MVVFLESDLENANMENPKIKQLEEIMSHLTHRVENTKGNVTAPAVKLLDILNQESYANFQNQTVKRHVTERIHQFLKLSIELQFPKSEDIGTALCHRSTLCCGIVRRIHPRTQV